MPRVLKYKKIKFEDVLIGIAHSRWHSESELWYYLVITRSKLQVMLLENDNFDVIIYYYNNQ